MGTLSGASVVHRTTQHTALHKTQITHIHWCCLLHVLKWAIQHHWIEMNIIAMWNEHHCIVRWTSLHCKMNITALWDEEHHCIVRWRTSLHCEMKNITALWDEHHWRLQAVDKSFTEKQKVVKNKTYNQRIQIKNVTSNIKLIRVFHSGLVIVSFHIEKEIQTLVWPLLSLTKMDQHQS